VAVVRGSRTERRSAELFEQARAVIPGGVSSPVRAMRSVGREHPLFLARGEGGWVWDADGNRYVDWVMSWGPLIAGHAHPAVVGAVRETAGNGTTFGAPTEIEVELARAVVAAVPSVEQVRFVSSGTEAAMSALRLARAFTGRDRILKFAGGYHGHADALLAQAGSGLATLGIPSSPGVPDAVVADTLVAEYNDLEAVRRIAEHHGDQLAAVIVEPVAGNMGVVAPEPGFLEGLRTVCNGTGALLITDEVITGFRIAYGGGQERFAVRPDLTCLGKIVGGGLPAAAFGGRTDVMALLAPEGDVYQAGTLSGNPLAMAAGLATLRILQEPGAYDRLERAGAALEAALAGPGITVNRVGAMLTAFQHPGPVRSYADAAASDTARFAAFHAHMLDRGIALAPSQFEAAMPSLAHTEEQLEITAAAAAEFRG
jgi:glutamate-1-semialdehyde 2,1-aminomutase